MKEKMKLTDYDDLFLIEKDFFYNNIDHFYKLKTKSHVWNDNGEGYMEFSYSNINFYMKYALDYIIKKYIYFKQSEIYSNIKFMDELDSKFVEFKEIIKKIIDQKNVLTSNSLDKDYDLYNYMIEVEKNNKKQFDRELDKNISNFSRIIVQIDKEFFKNSVEEIFEYANNINDEMIKIAKFREFVDYKEQMIENLECFCSAEQIENFKNNYDALLNSKKIEIEKLENFCNEYNEVIKKEYIKMMSNIDNFKSGEPFHFLCHSTNRYIFDGEFKSQFVSTSYISDELHDVFHEGYGFIFNPVDMVWASDKDSAIINSASDVSQISSRTYMPIFMHPKLIMKKNKLLKEANIKAGITDPVYSEVVIDGFNPIGIFCLTDGSKELNNNYQKALKLKEEFPELTIVDIDLSMYKNNDMSESKENLIYKLNSMFGNGHLNNKFILKKYDLFFDKFMEMKKNGNVTIDQIKELYQSYTSEFIENKSTLEQIFSGKYNYDEIYLHLDIKYNLSDMFKGKSIFKLESMAQDFANFDYSKIKDDTLKSCLYTLSNCYNNIDVELLAKTLQDNKVDNIYKFTNIVIEMLKNKNIEISDKLNVLCKEESLLENELEQYIRQNHVYEYSEKVINKEFYYNLLEKDLEYNSELQQKKDIYIVKREGILNKIRDYNNVKNKKQLEIENNEKIIMSLEAEDKDIGNQLKIIDDQLKKNGGIYNFFNKKQTKELIENREKLVKRRLNISQNLVKLSLIESEYSNFNLDYLIKINDLEKELETIDDKISEISVFSKENIYEDFFQEVGISFVNFKSELNKAKQYMKNFDLNYNFFMIEDLKKRLVVLSDKINSYQNLNTNINDIASSKAL